MPGFFYPSACLRKKQWRFKQVMSLLNKNEKSRSVTGLFAPPAGLEPATL